MRKELKTMKKFASLSLIALTILSLDFGGRTKTYRPDKSNLSNYTFKTVSKKGNVIVPLVNSQGNGNGLYVDFYVNTSDAWWPGEDRFYYSFVVDYSSDYQSVSLDSGFHMYYDVDFYFTFAGSNAGKGVYHYNDDYTHSSDRQKIRGWTDEKHNKTTTVDWVSCDSTPVNTKEEQKCRFTRKKDDSGWYDRWAVRTVMFSAKFRLSSGFTASLGGKVTF